MEKQHCYVILSYTGTLLSKAIRHYSGDKYVHASLSFDPSLSLMYSFGRRYPSNPIIAGYVHEDINQGLFMNMKNTVIQIYETEITEEQKQRLMDKINEFDANKRLYKYNLLGLLEFKLNKTIKIDKRKYFCSEFVSEVLRYAGLITSKKPDGLMKPKDLIRGRHFKKIYEGKLSVYRDRVTAKTTH